METPWAYVIKTKEGLDQIVKNEQNPEKAKQLMKQFLRDMKKKIPDDLKE